MSPPSAYQFGPFHLHVSRRLLRQGDQVVGIGSRAFDLLATLLAHAGEVVPPATLIRSAWPDTVVESSSLRVHISALRKTLGQAESGTYIQNIPGRGYSFVAPVRRIDDDAGDRPAAAAAPPSRTEAPGATLADAPALIGRDALVRTAADRLSHSRCLSLVGPPGIGKTSVAQHVCKLAAHELGADAVLLDLAPLTGAEHVASRLASRLGVGLDASDPVASLAAALPGRALLVLDNCEHLVDPVASLLEALLHHCGGLHALVTSREPLRIMGESVMRIPALEAPPAGWTGEEGSASFPAVALFLQRADELNDGFALKPGEAALVGAICRRLDGVPLAIELAAASTPALSLRQIAEHLDERLSLLVHGRRTALPRHRTLRAAIAWSYDLLSAEEQEVLQSLSAFAAWFTLDAAQAVSSGPDAPWRGSRAGFATLVHSLVSKSLLVVGGQDDLDSYRLLESVREFARERLASSGRAGEVARRHATQLQAAFDIPEPQRERVSRDEWVARCGAQLDDLRAALAWSQGPQGDPSLAIALLAASVPLWFSMALIGEFLAHAERSARWLERGVPPVAVLDLMRLYTGLGLARWHVHGPTVPARQAFERAEQLARETGDLAYQLRATWGLALACNASADYAGSHRLALRFGALIGPDPAPPLAVTHGLMMMLAQHLVGQHAAAEDQARRVLRTPHAVAFAGTSTGTQFDPAVAALALLGRLHWVRGQADTARQYCDEAVARACALDHAVSLCFAVAVGTAPVAHWRGDFARVRHDCALLIAEARRQSLRHWLGYGEAFHAAACLREGSRAWDDAVPSELASRVRSSMLMQHILSTFSEQFAPRDLDALLAGAETSWCAPELMRLQALRRLATSGARDPRVAQLLADSIQLARQQQALSWELRSTHTQALLLDQLGQRARALDGLAAVLSRLDQGQDTPDVAGARSTLAALVDR